MAKSSDMQNLIPAASISAGARTFSNESAFVASKKKNRFRFLDGIRYCGHTIIHQLCVCYDFIRHVQATDDGIHFSRILDLLINVEFLNGHKAGRLRKDYSVTPRVNISKATSSVCFKKFFSSSIIRLLSSQRTTPVNKDHTMSATAVGLLSIKPSLPEPSLKI